MRMHNQKGSVLVVTLLILVVMTVMGVSLVYEASKTDMGISGTISHGNALRAAETCVDRQVNWLKRKVTGGGTDKTPKITGNLRNYSSTDDHVNNKDYKEYLQRFRYECKGNLVAEEKVLQNQPGNEIKTEGYSGQNLKYFYLIESDGFGPKDSHIKLNVLVSLLGNGTT